MKTLLLMRHAKSSWENAQIPDHDRPLNKKGQEEVPLIGNLVKEKELVPQKIMVSSAVRAAETASIVQENCDFSGELDCLDSFYMAEPNVYLEPLRSLPDDIERVMVIGHNPGLEGLLQILSGQIVPLSAGSVAHISLPINQWDEVNLECEGELVETFSPRDLRIKEKKGKNKKVPEYSDLAISLG